MSTPLELDPDDFQERIRTAIEQYNEAIKELVANKPEINPAMFGEGFISHGEAVAASVNSVYERTLVRLRSRVAQYESMLALSGDASSVDGTNAGGFNTHE